MAIEKEYYITNLKFQKSQNFLWPLLGFRQNEKFKPECTYLYWTDGDFSIEDYNIIVYYKVDIDNIDFKKFEKEQILTKPNLMACFKTDGGILYIFDLIEFSNSVGEFLQGRYSKFDEKDKKIILSYFGDPNNKTVRPGRVIFMALEPHYFYPEISKELGVNENSLTELVDKYNFDEEVCNLPIIQNLDCSCDKKTFYL